jgi:hypothetical protein
MNRYPNVPFNLAWMSRPMLSLFPGIQLIPRLHDFPEGSVFHCMIDQFYEGGGCPIAFEGLGRQSEIGQDQDVSSKAKKHEQETRCAIRMNLMILCEICLYPLFIQVCCYVRRRHSYLESDYERMQES